MLRGIGIRFRNFSTGLSCLTNLNQGAESIAPLIFSGFLVHEISCLTHHYANKLRLSINLKFASEKNLAELNPDANRIYLD